MMMTTSEVTLVFDMILARVLKVRCEGVEVVNRNRSRDEDCLCVDIFPLPFLKGYKVL